MTSSSTLSQALPPSVAAAMWRADQLGAVAHATLPSGFDALDAALPGGGWPCRGLTELLCPQAGVLEWRLLGPALRAQTAGRKADRPADRKARVMLVAPPWPPHAPGLKSMGIDERRLVWIDASAPAERLWVVEQLLRARSPGCVLAWLPDARAGQLRRLQVLAGQAGADRGPVFIFRGRAAAHESSPAPLRVLAWPGEGWMLHVELLKRAGAPLGQVLALPAAPPGLAGLLPPERQGGWPGHPAWPASLAASPVCPETPDVVGRPAAIRSHRKQRPFAH